MTSIRYYKDPAIVKLDGRYKGYNRGFRYRIDFDVQGPGKWERWHQAVEWCERTWGGEYIWHHTGTRSWSTQYRTDIPKNKYFRQLYLRSEEDLTMLLLVIN